MSKNIQQNQIQVIPFLRILSSQSVYIQILEQLKKEQKYFLFNYFLQVTSQLQVLREVLMMCQSHNEYQVMKQEIKKRISKGNPITTLSIVPVIKTILTETKHSLMNFEGLFQQKSTDSMRKSSQNPQNTLSTQTQNPYSHILCFRLLKYAITKGNYGMLSLIIADLSELIYDVAIYDHNNENLQRGRGLYLQNYNLSNNQRSLPMTFDEMEHIGYSVHTFSLETMFVLGNQIKFLPYHQNFIKQNQTKNSNQKPLKQNHKIFGQYSSELLESKCHQMYVKTKQLKVNYGQKLYYFKSQEIQKYYFLKTRLHSNSFNSEQIHYKIREFYEFLFGLTIQRQVHLNDKIIKTINEFNEVQFGNFYRRYLKKPSVNAFLLTLKQIMHTNDRYCLYFTIILINETLKFIETIEGEKRELIFYSVCEILDELILKIKLEEDETEQNVHILQLKEFNYEMYQGLDKVIGFRLFKMYEKIFGTMKEKMEERSYFHQYAKKYFHYFLLKVQKVYKAINQNIKKCSTLKVPGVQNENSFFSQQKNILLRFEKEENFGIKHMNTSFSQYRLLRRLDCLKANFPIPLEFIQSKNLRIHKDALKFLKDQQKLFSNDSIIKKAKIQCKVDTPPFKNQNKEYKQMISIDDVIEAASRERKSEELTQSDDDIPVEAIDVVKTVDYYQLRMKNNDISKINLKRTKTTRTTKITERSEFTLRDSSSIRETLRRGTIKMNLADRDIQALKTSNQNKYQRKQSNSRMNSQARGFETVLEPLSSPTFGDQSQIDEVVEQLNATYKDLLSEKTFNKKSNQEKVDNFLTPYEELKSGEIRAIIDMMRIRSGHPSKLHNQKPFTFEPQRPVHMAHLVTPYPTNDLLNVKNQLSNQKDGIFRQMDESGPVQSFGKFQKQKTQNIADLINNQSKSETIPADSFLGVFLPKNNKQTKSKFHNSTTVQTPVNKKFFQHIPIPSNSSLQQPISPTFKVAKQLFDSRDNIELEIMIFAFSLKMRRQILKKKVLLIKDEMIEIGMITQLQVPVKQIPFLNQKLKQRKGIAFQAKLKATLYVTSLSKQVQQIQIDAHCPSWMSSRILQNKLKQITKANSQYASIIEFSLQNIQQPKPDIQKLPSLQITLKKKTNQKPYKNYELQLPLFLNKFFSEQVVNEDEISSINNKFKLSNMIWLDVSSRLIKEFTQLGKYFTKLKSGDQQISMTKVSFLKETIYLCFRDNTKNRNSQESTASISKPLSFIILHENEIHQIETVKQLNSEKKNSQIYDLMQSTYRSLLGE